MVVAVFDAKVAAFAIVVAYGTAESTQFEQRPCVPTLIKGQTPNFFFNFPRINRITMVRQPRDSINFGGCETRTVKGVHSLSSTVSLLYQSLFRYILRILHVSCFQMRLRISTRGVRPSVRPSVSP